MTLYFRGWTIKSHSPEYEISPINRSVQTIEIIDIECGLLSRVSQKIVATKWRIYKGKISSPQDILCKSNR